MTDQEFKKIMDGVLGDDATTPPDPREECAAFGHVWPVQGYHVTRTLTRFYCRRCGERRDVDTLHE